MIDFTDMAWNMLHRQAPTHAHTHTQLVHLHFKDINHWAAFRFSVCALFASFFVIDSLKTQEINTLFLLSIFSNKIPSNQQHSVAYRFLLFKI